MQQVRRRDAWGRDGDAAPRLCRCDLPLDWVLHRLPKDFEQHDDGYVLGVGCDTGNVQRVLEHSP